MITSCTPKTAPLVATEQENTYLQIDSGATYSRVNSQIQPYRDSLALEMHRPLTVLNRPITHSRNNPNTLIGPWICDILLEEGKEIFDSVSIHAAIYNPGGIRSPRLSDTIRVRDIYELLPFDNYLALLEVTGEQLQEWIKHTVSRGGWPVSHTMEVYVSSPKSIQVLVDGAPLQPHSTYRVLTNDYIANGGDDCDFLAPIPFQKSQSFIRDIVIRHFDRSPTRAVDRTTRIHFMTQN
jgi:2',3'-cyclic-nucleotide 2'-phosphodiesterase (5'-nucleotidase family)